MSILLLTVCSMSAGAMQSDVISSPFRDPIAILIYALIIVAVVVTVILIFILGKKSL